jgi:uncharacterized protein
MALVWSARRLVAVDSPSAIGPWSYEVADTKLALDTRAGTILQLGLYCDLLAVIQSLGPEHFYVVTPDRDAPVEAYRVNDYAAYFRLLRSRFEAVVEGDDSTLAAANYPDRLIIATSALGPPCAAINAVKTITCRLWLESRAFSGMNW